MGPHDEQQRKEDEAKDRLFEELAAVAPDEPGPPEIRDPNAPPIEPPPSPLRDYRRELQEEYEEQLDEGKL